MTNQEPVQEPICVVCNVTEAEHNARHEFTPTGTRVDTAQFARKRRKGTPEGDATRGNVPGVYSVAQTPFDPVLRQALIDKGILTVEDLDEARKKIEAITAHVMGGPKPPTMRGDDGPR